ncbi:class I SAM-dependent methyltransferase [Candidatus Saccharibacteria bacterium]|nr:class I SAM-dependent methyltransferase [Candidatus Saccharibacteria bacterium]
MIDAVKQNTQTYDKIASSYSKRNYEHFWIDEFDYYKSIIDGKKVVDLGCGAGRDAEVFVKNGFDHTGVDASSGMLKIAKKRVPSGNFRKMNFAKLSFKDSEFDGFWAAASFLYVPKKRY